MNSDWLLVLIVPCTLGAAYIKYKNGRRSAFLARVYMLIVFTLSGLASLGLVPLDTETRVFFLRCGFLAVVLEECITYIKINRWSRKVNIGNGKPM